MYTHPSPGERLSSSQPSGFSRDQQEQLNGMHQAILAILEFLRKLGHPGDQLTQIQSELRQVSLKVSRVDSRLNSAFKEFYTVAEVARLTNRSEDTVRRWIREGRLAAIRVEGTGPKGPLLIPREALNGLVSNGLAQDLPAFTVT